ncbi:esterase-like activity of phytase family protein [Bowmanella dokdonensis]|uniref:Phytase-like domain-containing protein n=1 Tax=Bowmanella dokdonensis TaxID=751969 RepID=A0A939DJC3_9ALTE|nr:esterase-like activity of phytase family protein [Bowmanella dokdonensis]MBN7823758.1 hypothetical protein [Bowmanella dokdonensis]
MKYLFTFFGLCISLSGCISVTEPVSGQTLQVDGIWIRDSQGQVMADPQPSGLVRWRNQLLTLSDRSAMATQRLRLHKLDTSGNLLAGSMPISVAESLSTSCFADYVGTNPDLEALVVDPRDDRVFITVTEDASDSPLRGECARRYADTGSTLFPTLLLRLELQADNRLLVSHIRPLRFAGEYRVGNFPNDGVEGLAFTPDGTLYLALEKDQASQPRIFSLAVAEDFWQSDEFAEVKDARLLLPGPVQGNHPINALEYAAGGEGKGYLLAAARNDDQLWILDLDRRRPTRIVQMEFWAPAGGPGCPERELMDNASIEGIALLGNDIWMINDPWKVNYMKNVNCAINAPHYRKMAPLLFRLPLQSGWLD